MQQPHTGDSLKERTAKGLLWGGMNSGVQQLVGLVFGIILGRLLSPADYGMVAMITVFSVVANELQASGFKPALINRPEVRHDDYNAVFWFNIIAGLILYAALFLAAPLIAAYYKQPDLVPLCRYVFVGFVLSGWGMAQSAWLTKQLRVQEIARSGMAAVLLSSVTGAVMAWQGCGYWSLATQSLVYIGVNTALLWHYSTWRPTLHVDLRPAMQMLGFGSKMMATNVLQAVNNNLMNILLGRFFTKTEVGQYNNAYQWNQKVCLLLQSAVYQVAQPVFSLVDADRQRQLRILRKLVRFTAFVSFPLLLGFGLVAQEFLVVTIGAKWLPSARLLQWLVVGGAVAPLSIVLSNLLVSQGRSGLFFMVTSCQTLATLVALLCLHGRGLTTMTLAYVAIQVAWLFVWHAFVWRATGYSLWQLLSDVVPFALIAGGVMAATHFATLPVTRLAIAPVAALWVLLASRVVLAALLYIGLMRLLRVKILDEIVQFVRQAPPLTPPRGEGKS